MEIRTSGSKIVAVSSFIIALTALCIPLSFPSLSHAGSQFEEYQVKSAFMYNFVKFIEWPAGTFHEDDSSVRICILGKDPFGETLDRLRNKSVGSRKLVVEKLKRGESSEKCQVLFISDSEKGAVAEILRSARKRPVLTVGDMKGFVQSGGMVNFIAKGDQVGFEINVDAAERSRLKVSAQLLQVANIYREKH